MLRLGIRYLNGWAMATHPADRQRAEWPPHPDRVFMALAAAHFLEFETGVAVDPDTGEVLDTAVEPEPSEQQREEQAALDWLASLDAPPRIEAPEAEQRTTMTHYVPVNDAEINRPKKDSAEKQQKRLNKLAALDTTKKARDAGLTVLPEKRGRQPRTFPVALPVTRSITDDPIVHLVWPDAEPGEDKLAALDALCRRVTSVGHSASLVQMWASSDAAATVDDGERGEAGDARRMLIPVEGVSSQYRLRVPTEGRLSQLRASFEAGQWPSASFWWGYHPKRRGEPAQPSAGTCFSPDLIVLRRVDGPGLDTASASKVTAALHKTLLKHVPDPVPEWISGHTPEGKRSEQDHLALMPLPHVGSDYADGHLLGIAMALPVGQNGGDPSALDSQALASLLFNEYGEPKDIPLKLGQLGVWSVRLDDREGRPFGLRPETWTGLPNGQPAQQWASVTPIALDRHPKGRDKWQQMRQQIAAACERVLRPPHDGEGGGASGDGAQVKDITLSPVSIFRGADTVHSMPNLRRKRDGGRIHHTHAVITFDRPIQGPLLLGAGRYRGYGLCRAVPEQRDG